MEEKHAPYLIVILDRTSDRTFFLTCLTVDSSLRYFFVAIAGGQEIKLDRPWLTNMSMRVKKVTKNLPSGFANLDDKELQRGR